MNAAVIKVKFANAPKEGKKKATIKTDDDQIFGVWPRQLGLFQPGRSYKIEFEEHDWQGRTYRTITKCEPATDAAPSNESGSASNAALGEAEFVTRILAASIQACCVGHMPQAIAAEIRMLRGIWRETMT